jgi:sulfotransferase
MAGLPRTGSTVLSALLNQHPDIYSSPQSDLVNVIYSLDSMQPHLQTRKAELFESNYSSLMAKVGEAFYQPVNKKIVIDKNRAWGTPYNFLKLSPHLNPHGKIIITLRPILEILASFIKVSNATEEKTGVSPFYNSDLWLNEYRPKNDAIVDTLMMPNGDIDKAIYSVSNLLKNHGEKVHVVWFDWLLENPKATMTGIYEFLEVNLFDNDFEHIKSVDEYDDLNGYGVVGLHDIKSKLIKPNTNPSDYLSDYAIDKYKNALDFLWSE